MNPESDDAGITLEERVKFARDEKDNYQLTVHSLIGFAAFVTHDGEQTIPGSQFGIGRRMHTSDENIISGDEDITPDLVTQKNLDYGIVLEVKSTLGAQIDRHIRRLRKYDDELEGWWTDNEMIRQSDAILLLHQDYSRSLKERIEEKEDEGSSLIGDRSSLVEFNRNEKREPYIFFRKEWGNLSDAEVDQELIYGTNIPLVEVLKEFSSLKFYDAKPSLPHMLTLLWNNLFPANTSDDNYDPESNTYYLEVSVEEITEELQKAYGSHALDGDERSKEFPRESWIREALEALVDIDKAVPTGDHEYEVAYKQFRKSDDVFEKFVDLTDYNPIEEGPQRELFED